MSTTDIRSCEDALRVLAAHIDGELEQATRDQVERHLETCRTCFSRAEFERRLKDSLAALGREPVRPQLTDRVRALIDEFTVASHE